MSLSVQKRMWLLPVGTGSMEVKPTPYLPCLDGLRGAMVLCVMGAHSAYHFPGDGGTAVDVFFVLSGFLITSLLTSEAADGAINLWRFYFRRALRLFPCLILVCITVELLSIAIGRPHDGNMALIALTYTANWAAAFGLNVGVYLHTWSLSSAFARRRTQA